MAGIASGCFTNPAIGGSSLEEIVSISSGFVQVLSMQIQSRKLTDLFAERSVFRDSPLGVLLQAGPGGRCRQLSSACGGRCISCPENRRNCLS